MVTNREVERIRKTRFVRWTTWIVERIAPTLRLLLKRAPSLRSRLTTTLGGRSGAIYSLIEKRRFAEAFSLSIEGVTYCESGKTFFDLERMYWWTFVHTAALSASELGDAERAVVFSQLQMAPEPGGFMEAQCLE